MAHGEMKKTALLLKLEQRVREAGYTVSDASWEDETHAYACSVEGCGPATYGHPRVEFMERRATPVSWSWSESIGR